MSKQPTSCRSLPWWVSLAALAAGLPLVGWMVVYEGEPGALPLGLVVAGAAGLLWSRWRTVSTRGSDAPR